MDEAKQLSKDTPTPEQHAVADALHAFCPHLTKDADKQNYITLEVVMGRSQANKNAISILPDRVSFMVTDWSAEASAKDFNIETVRSKKYRRLQFPGLTTALIQQHSEFFQEMVVKAFRESQMKQGYFHFAGSGADITIYLNGHPVEGEWLTKLSEAAGKNPEEHTKAIAAFMKAHVKEEQSN